MNDLFSFPVPCIFIFLYVPNFLNFFKWFIENEVLNYSIENIEKIDKDMMETLNINKSNHKRKELSHSASKTLCKHEFDTLIKFN